MHNGIENPIPIKRGFLKGEENPWPGSFLVDSSKSMTAEITKYHIVFCWLSVENPLVETEGRIGSAIENGGHFV